MSIVFMGTPDVAVPVAQAVYHQAGSLLRQVYTQPDKPVGRKKLLTPSPVRRWAEQHGIEVKTPHSAKAPEVTQELKDLSPDVVIVCAYGQILPQSLLDVAKIGFFNLHYSFLPRWRGASPVQAAIKEGDQQTGVSLQRMVYKLDAGPLVAESSPVIIQPHHTYETLAMELAQAGAELVKQTLPALLEGNFDEVPQDEKLATYCRIIKKEQGRINWSNQSAVHIERTLRAYTPWPGIYCLDHREKRLQILKVEVLETASRSDHPGRMDAEGIIQTCEGMLKLIEVKPEGKKAMPVTDYLRGNPDQKGRILL